MPKRLLSFAFICFFVHVAVRLVMAILAEPLSSTRKGRCISSTPVTVCGWSMRRGHSSISVARRFTG